MKIEKRTFLTDAIIEYSKKKIYFHVNDLKNTLRKKNFVYGPDSLKKALYRLSKNKILYHAGRGWYSKIKEAFVLNLEPVKPVAELLREKFPLLKFSLWSTEQLKECFHHLPTQFLTFIYADKSLLSSLKDFLEDRGYAVFLNPSKKDIDKYVSFKRSPFILRPAIFYRGVKRNHFKSIEQILVDLYVESNKIDLLDLEEYKHILRNILLNFRINISELLDYAHNRKVKTELKKIIFNVMSTYETF